MQNKIKKAQAGIKRLFDQQHPVCCAWSGGKDSSSVLNLVLATAVEHASPSPIVIIYADTGIENPTIDQHVKAEIVKIKAFAKLHNLL